MNEIIGTALADDLIGGSEDDIIVGGLGDDFIVGGAGNDSIEGGAGNDGLFAGGELGNREAINDIGGRDTLLGGEGDDIYFVSLTTSGGSEIRDSSGADLLVIVAANTDLENLSFDSSSTFGDSAIELSLPQAGIVGLQKSGTELIIDINRDGNAERQNDLTVFNFFNEQGQLGSGAVDIINNITDAGSIVDLFEDQEEVTVLDDFSPGAVYRFFNNDTGVHFYTASDEERSAVADLNNFSYEGASYVGVGVGVDPLTGSSDPLPVYRFLNEDTGVHLYTISETERDAVEELDNFSFEGEAFFAYETEVEGSIPIYRFFNPSTGAHFYTPSATERDNVEDNLPDFQSEGIAYYAFPIETELS